MNVMYHVPTSNTQKRLTNDILFISSSKPFTILDIESKEDKDGTSLSNKTEANLALHLFSALRDTAQVKTKIAILTPYQQQVGLLKRIFQDKYGLSYIKLVDISTVDSFQGKESPLSSFRASVHLLWVAALDF
jgi:Superfamily I DNA and RNA helicases and helicase subunits